MAIGSLESPVSAPLVAQRVTRLPLQNLWDDNGSLEARKGRALSASDIHSFLLRDRPVRFVVANVDSPLLWVELPDSFLFWNTQVRVHLYEPAKQNVSDYSNGYYYVAHEWHLADGERIIGLERHQ